MSYRVNPPLNPLRSPLYRRLLLWFCAANVATLLVSVFATERFARMAYDADPDWPALAQDASAEYQRGGVDALGEWSEARRREGVDATLFEDQRNLLPRPLPPPLRHALPRLMGEDDLVLRPRPEMLVATIRVTGSDGVMRQFVALRGPRPPHATIHQLLAVQIALSLLVIAVLGWWIARSIARPVAALQIATQRMAAGELSARVGVEADKKGDELTQLARDFDRMAGRIEALVANERSVLQDVSHELRSPLARLHLLLELAGGGDATAFPRAEAEIARLDRRIGETLALSRMEADLPGMLRERVDLGALLHRLLDAARLETDARGLHLDDRAIAADVAVSGNTALLERAIENLLSNAIKFSAPGGAVEISLRAIDGQAELCVRDHGPGVPEAELASLFRPFFRGRNAALAEGDGIGLAIVQRIAGAHHGTVFVENAVDGGLRVRLGLPLAVNRLA